MTQYSLAVVFILAALSIHNIAGAQSLSDDQQKVVITKAKQQLDEACREQGSLRQFFDKNNISGNADVDITIGHKGEILTVFLAHTDISEVTQRNGLMNALTQFKLKDISVPKKQRIKFSYHLTIQTL
ncbi:MAG: hypothetical protein JST69_05875 [Bacteroidetes bacterium]|nr:hypothetical protein [Bacteroidota bacterium]